MIEEDTRRAVARHRSEIWLSICLTNIALACNFFYHRCVRCALPYTILLRAEEEEVMRECNIRHAHAIKTNSAVNLSRKPYREYHAPVVFTLLSCVHRFCSSHHSNGLSYATPPPRIITIYCIYKELRIRSGCRRRTCSGKGCRGCGVEKSGDIISAVSSCRGCKSQRQCQVVETLTPHMLR